MGRLYIFLSVLMCVVLIWVQISRTFPIWTEIPEDPYLGEPLQPFQSFISRGIISLDIIGNYKMHEAMIYINGERYLLVEKFPVKIQVIEGDVLEVWVLEELPGTSLVVKNTSANIKLKYSRTSIPLSAGLHRIGKVVTVQ